jgi:hypothetical protein
MGPEIVRQFQDTIDALDADEHVKVVVFDSAVDAYVGGGPTPDKPSVTLSVPDPDKINGFMNIRVADIQACYEL